MLFVRVHSVRSILVRVHDGMVLYMGSLRNDPFSMVVKNTPSPLNIYCSSHVRIDENILCMLVYDNNGTGYSSSHASMCVCAQCVSVRVCVNMYKIETTLHATTNRILHECTH